MPQPGDKVSVHYTGTLDDGTQFDSSRGREPLDFEMGAGQLIPGFEAAVAELSVGETTTFRIEAEDAYGPVVQSLIIHVPKDKSPSGITVGTRVEMVNGSQGIVTEITDEVVKIDTNHPLAGQALTFEVELLAIGGAS